VPEQVLSDPETGDEIVLLRWDFDLSAVEVRYRGTPIARVGNFAILRSDLGMPGPTPDGKVLTIWAVRSTGAESFEATIDGEVLSPGPVRWTNALESPPEPSSMTRSQRRAAAKEEHAMRVARGTARRSLRPVILIVALTVIVAAGGWRFALPRFQAAASDDAAAATPAHPAASAP
jgi:hypothetical protein